APAVPLARLLMFWGSVQQGYWGFSHNPCEYASRVRCPVLLLHGACDSWVLKPEIECIFNRLGGPKQLVEFDSCGHQAYRSAEPEHWLRVVHDFLSTIR